MVVGLRSALLRYGLAILLFVLVIAISVVLQHYGIKVNMAIAIVLGLVIASWYGGRGPGLLNAALIQAVNIYSNPVAPDSTIAQSAFGHFSVFLLLVLIVFLIVGRKSVEKRLRDQGDLLRITLESIGDAVITTNSEGQIAFLNSTAERLIACTAEEAKLRSIGEVYKVVDENSGEPIGDIFATIKDTRQIITLSPNTTLISNDERHIPISDTGTPILDSNGNFMGAVIVFQDVTERRQAEHALLETEARLRQSQKLEAVGTLTGGVAHDFNNLLTAILGYTQLSIRKLPLHDPVMENLVTVEKAANRGAELTKKLLAFSRQQHLDRRVIDLNDSITEILVLLRRVIGEDVKVSFTAATDLCSVFADPSQIEQVILNLSLNARDAMPTGGKLMIETRNVELDEHYCLQYPSCEPGQYVQILVSDTGVGMDAETMGRIFEPFFTTKEVNKGTGLGLSMAYGIVKQHGGQINVYSEPGHGTTFKIFLPIVVEEVETKQQPRQPSLLGGTETILVAEDEEPLRNLTNDVLSSLGYKVIAAKNGEEAVELFTANKNAIDLLLFDVVMPMVGGPEAYKTIRDMIGKDIPLIFMTGYSSEVLESPYVKQSNAIDFASARIIQKPYTLDALGRIVRDTLDLS